MTPAALILARDGDAGATAEATAVWDRLLGSAPDDGIRSAYGAALDAVSVHVGADTDVPAWTLEEALHRCGGLLDRSRSWVGIREMDDGMEFDPLAAQSAFRRSGAMTLLVPWASPSAGVI